MMCLTWYTHTSVTFLHILYLGWLCLLQKLQHTDAEQCAKEEVLRTSMVIAKLEFRPR